MEGFARFIEEQVVELGRLGGDLQDETAMSLDVSSGLLSGSNLIPADTFIRMSQLGFGKLPSDPIGSLKLRHSLLELQLTPKVIFYAQAGAMSYFMMHERGPEGRAGLIKYMREFYTTGVKKRGWKTLGFDSPDHMKEEFERFLGRIAKG